MGIIRSAAILILFQACIQLCFGQQEVDALVQKFNQYQSELPRTKVHLIFNQDKYSPGDTAWFKVYFVTEDLLGIEGQHLINLDLLSSNGTLTLKQLFSVTDGKGQNQILIPDTLSAGIYKVVAYSDWMKNFDVALANNLEIVTKNTLLMGGIPVLKASVEGGYLVAEVFNKVVVHTSSLASGLQLIDTTGRVYQELSPNDEGFASFIFKPEAGNTYKIKNERDLLSLPVPQREGCSLLATPSEFGEPLKIMISSPQGSIYRSQMLIAIISSQGKIYSTGSFKMEDKDFVPIEIAQNDLPEGVAHLSILSKSGILIAHRDFFVSKPKDVNVRIQSDKPFYSTRDKISLDIALKDAADNSIEGEFAISVVNKSLFNKRNTDAFTHAWHLFSQLDNSTVVKGQNWFSNLDFLLILNPRPMPWQEIVAEKVTKPIFASRRAIEKKGIIYYGDSNEPVPAFSQVMFYLQKKGWHYQTFTLESGEVWLTLPDIYGVDELFYIVETKNGKEIKNARIKWKEESNMVYPSPYATRESNETDGYASFIERARIINKSYDFFTSTNQSNVKSISNKDKVNKESLFKSDISILIQDYILFPTMEELIREIVPSLFIRGKGRNVIVRINLLSPMISTRDPLYIIDGIATNNTDFFLSLDPAVVITVKVINDPKKLMPLGLMGKNGIVMVETKTGLMRETPDPSNLVMGLSKSIEFERRDYSKAGSPIHPDFRSTLYWNPSVVTNTNGSARIEFYTTDDITNWTVIINGITSEGRPFSANHEVSVDQK